MSQWGQWGSKDTSSVLKTDTDRQGRHRQRNARKWEHTRYNRKRMEDGDGKNPNTFFTLFFPIYIILLSRMTLRVIITPATVLWIQHCANWQLLSDILHVPYLSGGVIFLRLLYQIQSEMKRLRDRIWRERDSFVSPAPPLLSICHLFWLYGRCSLGSVWLMLFCRDLSKRLVCVVGWLKSGLSSSLGWLTSLILPQ